ncbi:chloride channel protein [Futiania mangrovi]|uniref:Chloride channel protein n=1 Tax=Futiania mangrovi TaxID=2959716 RepID=A0A9J6P9M2_9PROT|nr:chloride channel protein [Futiania mangrovii]MCP1334969.1 chloride channel protein [Futiania mangrovii]
MRDYLKAAAAKRLWWDLTHSTQPVVWLYALALGTVAAYGALLFWWCVSFLQTLAFGANEAALATGAEALPAWRVVAVTAGGGLLVGLILRFTIEDRRIHGVADVIKARLLRRAKMSRRIGLISALCNVIALGSGFSMGREGPVVHLGATLSTLFARRIGLPQRERRILLGCGVAAAVSASFNAPIAGVLFALEVVLGHYAPSAFAPIVIASVMGTLVSRLHLGNAHVFEVPIFTLQSYWEIPAFALLGLVCGLVAIAFTRSIFLVEDVAARTRAPIWLRTTLAGALVGAIATQMPQVLGVGYEAVGRLLEAPPGFVMLVALAAAKTAATAITIGGRAGSGVFSPSLYVGLVTGTAFWIVAAAAFPQLAGPHGLYALIGMAAVSAAVLGAPISTTLISFELTGNYQVAIFAMIAASISSMAMQYFAGSGFFRMQLVRSGVPVEEPPTRIVLDGVTVTDVMREAPELPPGIGLNEDTPRIAPDASLAAALDLMERENREAVWIVDPDEPERAIGVVRRSDAYRTLARALLDAHEEEHR